MMYFGGVQLLSRVCLFAAPWTAARQASLSFTVSQSLLKPMSIESMMPSNHLVFYLPRLVFSNESALLIRRPKYSFSFSISPSNEYSGLISFTIDWFDLLAVQGTLKSLLQHHSSKAPVLYSPVLTSIHDHWKNHSCEYVNLCQQNDVFLIRCLGLL